MNDRKLVKLFYSYCHEDAAHKDGLHNRLAELIKNQVVEIWHDKDIPTGHKFKTKISEELKQSDIVICFLSEEYFASDNCVTELKLAYEQQKLIVSIILGKCSWDDFKFDDNQFLSEFLALPLSDDKNNLIPILDWEDENKAWENVYKKLSLTINDEHVIKNCQLKDDFNVTINSCDELKSYHLIKGELILDDIYIWPEFQRGYMNNTKEAERDNLFNDIYSLGKIWIIGEDRSGKTALARKMFLGLKERGFIPVLFYPYVGKFENQLKKEISEQYVNLDIKLDDNRHKIIPIMDDFHRHQGQDNLIAQLKAEYPKHILITDMAFSFNFRNQKLNDVSMNYCRYKINEFYPSKRNDLIRKWISIGVPIQSKNDLYKKLDKHTMLINSTIGKTLKHGIVPPYPFFLLTIIGAYEKGNNMQLADITSQGHCYYALIYLNFMKQGLNHNDIDEYLNFLYSLAYHFYKNNIDKISEDELESFIENDYKKQFNLSIKRDLFIKNLNKMEFLIKDNLRFYRFHYKYFYFYFVAKYITDNLKETEKDIENIFANLHTNMNAHIAIFLSHHSKNEIILENIWLNANVLFDKYKPATLGEEESFLIDEKMLISSELILPNENRSESVREEALKKEDEQEKASLELEDYDSDEKDQNNSFLTDLRKCDKTVEVMGQIIKNRSGSLPIEKIKIIFEDAMNIHLRVLGYYFEFVKKDGAKYKESMAKNLQELAEYHSHELTKEQAEEFSNRFFSNMNFHVIMGCMEKIVFSLGSDKLSKNISQVCDKIDTPISILIKRWVLIQYKQNLSHENSYEDIKKDSKNFSSLATRIRNLIIVGYCYFHEVSNKERQKIRDNLKIPIYLSSPREKKIRD